MSQDNTLVEARNLKKYFSAESGLWGKSGRKIFAVNDVSFKIREGETLGLVGESGCGKTTTGKLILRLLEATEGEVYFDKNSISNFSSKELTKIRRDAQIIFQDPYSSLNPRKTVGKIIEDSLRIHDIGNARTRMNRVIELLNIVGLLPEHINRYPHEFSGGQRQRIGIARALVINPKFVVCDEPVSALDVSIQAQILNLLEDLQQKFNLTYLFIAHNFSVVKHISRRIAVMYLGKIVEIGKNEDIYEKPLHPYTQFLLSAIPVPDPDRTRKRKRMILEGDVPSPIDLPSGCFFHPRCPHMKDICMKEQPQLVDYGADGEHLSACHFSEKFTGMDI
jgi:oligopeptide/dipeptide ABC transporter ATP-binding protein